MTRPEHLDASGLSAEEVGRLLDAVASVAEPVQLAFLWRPVTPDPNDDMVLETAVNGMADAIATFNARDLAQPSERFGIAAVVPKTLIEMLEQTR